MTINEIYQHIISHMIKGMMVHEQMANYYDFLGLQGYKTCHEFHYMEESFAYREVCHYFISHFNMLIQESKFENPNIVPNTWYKYKRGDVDGNTKRQTVKQGFNKWIKWEQDTKLLYEQMYKEMMDLNEIASALFFKKFICDVDKELEEAEQKNLNLKSVDYNITYIMDRQYDMCDCYKNKIHKFLKERSR